jgi:predicted SprT family Zn-dependent metalloprotease
MMNDPDRLLQQVIAEARAIRIPVSRAICPTVRINTRATTRFGRCIREGWGWVIELSDRMLDAPERSCRQTLAHEILHTCRGCANHQAAWKEYARRMSEAYGYDIRRTDDCEHLGVVDTRTIRYRLVCERCGATIGRTRRSALVEHPERYRCRCGGRLIPDTQE